MATSQFDLDTRVVHTLRAIADQVTAQDLADVLPGDEPVGIVRASLTRLVSRGVVSKPSCRGRVRYVAVPRPQRSGSSIPRALEIIHAEITEAMADAVRGGVGRYDFTVGGDEVCGTQREVLANLQDRLNVVEQNLLEVA